MISPHERQDKLVRATDLDALACRFSADKQKYFDPPDSNAQLLLKSYEKYLQYCTGYTNLSAGRAIRGVLNEKKLPLINRGTYLRTELIDIVLNEFALEFGHCQIILLGSGSDTRAFRMLQKYNKLIYHDIDFPESIKIKKLAVLGSSHLHSILNYTGDASDGISSREEFNAFEASFHSERYHMHGYDLRNIKNAESVKESFKQIDFSLPTIVLSECVLCYISPEDNLRIISSFRESFAQISLLMYEPMSLGDCFGETMTKNLLTRGLTLPTFDAFPNLQLRQAFLRDKCGFPITKLTNMSEVGGYSGNITDRPWLSISELRRISRLEMVDEIEEMKLLFEHYCLCYAEKSPEGSQFKGINKWRWLL